MRESADHTSRPYTGNAFLLAQIGAHAAARFAERIASVNLTPPQAGLLRLIAWQPGQSQQLLAGQMRTPPSRLVLLLDQLEDRGLIERQRNPDDRRHHAVYLTSEGADFLRDQLGPVAAAHEDDTCAALSSAERGQLLDLLSRIATQQQLTPGVHPGYQHLGP